MSAELTGRPNFTQTPGIKPWPISLPRDHLAYNDYTMNLIIEKITAGRKKQKILPKRFVFPKSFDLNKSFICTKTIDIYITTTAQIDEKYEHLNKVEILIP